MERRKRLPCGLKRGFMSLAACAVFAGPVFAQVHIKEKVNIAPSPAVAAIPSCDCPNCDYTPIPVINGVEKYGGTDTISIGSAVTIYADVQCWGIIALAKKGLLPENAKLPDAIRSGSRKTKPNETDAITIGAIGYSDTGLVSPGIFIDPAGDTIRPVRDSLTIEVSNDQQFRYIADSALADPTAEVLMHFSFSGTVNHTFWDRDIEFVTANQPKLVIVYPTDGLKEEEDITKDPKMPDITPQAQLQNYSGGTVNFGWDLRVQWTGRDGRKFDDSFHGNTSAQNSNVSSWSIDWNKMIRGGDEITLDVTATAGGKDYHETVNHGFIIKGDNPDRTAVKTLLTVEEQVIAYMESRFRQFWSDKNFPIFGAPHGYGLMQLDPPDNNEEVWDWKANAKEGQSRFAKKKNLATKYPSRVKEKGGAYRYATNYTQQQFLTDAFQLYNGYHYWIWVPADPNRGGGSWQKDPNLGKPKTKGGYGGDYGGPAIKIYNEVMSHHPPSDW